MRTISVLSLLFFFILLHDTDATDYHSSSGLSGSGGGVAIALYIGVTVVVFLVIGCVVGCACYYRKKWEREETQDIQQQHAIIRRQYAKNLEFNPPPVYPYSPTPVPNREVKPIVPYAMIGQPEQVKPVPTYSMVEQPNEVDATQEDSNPK